MVWAVGSILPFPGNHGYFILTIILGVMIVECSMFRQHSNLSRTSNLNNYMEVLLVTLPGGNSYILYLSCRLIISPIWRSIFFCISQPSAAEVNTTQVNENQWASQLVHLKRPSSNHPFGAYELTILWKPTSEALQVRLRATAFHVWYIGNAKRN